MQEEIQADSPKEYPELKWLDRISSFLDNQFRIPGTQIRFGFDFIVGLIPGIGDLVSFGLSGLLVLMMTRYGASGIVVMKMLGNLTLDTTLGAVPIIGDLFDLGYKSNLRNLNLLKEHYQEGEHQGSAWPVIIVILVVLVAMFMGLIWLVWKIVNISFQYLGNLF